MFRGHVVRSGIGALTSAALATVALAQETEPSRASDEHAATAASSVEVHSADRVSRIVDKIASFAADSDSRKGAAPAWGEIGPGSGPAAGVRFRRTFASDSLVLRGLVLGSVRRSTLIRSSLAWPELFGGKAALRIVAEQQHAASTRFFGIAATQPRARSVYGLRSASLSASITVRPHRSVSITGSSGLVVPRVTQGRSPKIESIGYKYDYGDAPGLFLSPRYVRTTAELMADWRNDPGYPTRGGQMRVAWSRYDDRSISALSFAAIDVDTVHYLPLRRDVSTLVLRGRFMRADAMTYHRVPFYFLPSLGGNDSLRGYADFRFKDRNAVLGTAEYRWSVRRTLDVAVFTDAGTTGETLGRLRHTKPEGNVGVGVRFHTNRSSTVRIDVARGREGVRLGASWSAPFERN